MFSLTEHTTIVFGAMSSSNPTSADTGHIPPEWDRQENKENIAPECGASTKKASTEAHRHSLCQAMIEYNSVPENKEMATILFHDKGTHFSTARTAITFNPR